MLKALFWKKCKDVITNVLYCDCRGRVLDLRGPVPIHSASICLAARHIYSLRYMLKPRKPWLYSDIMAKLLTEVFNLNSNNKKKTKDNVILCISHFQFKIISNDT